MKEFFKAFVYFMENGIPEKLAKDLAEKLTGVKADDFNRNVDDLSIEDVRVKDKGQPKKLATKKMRGDLPFINTKLSNPMTNKMVLKGLDGTTESLYSQFRVELEAYKNGLEKNLKFIKENNIALSSKDKDNITYNIKLVNNLNNKVDQLADDLVTDGKEPEKIYQDFRKIKKVDSVTADIERVPGLTKDLESSMKKIKKLIDEMDDIKSGKAEKDRMSIVKRKYQGKGYGPSEGIYRTLARQFLADEIEAGRIETTPAIYNAMREGGHPFIDAIKVFRHHYGDDSFDTLEKYIDNNYPEFGSPGIKYPGKFEFRKLGLVPKNKKAPGKTYAHYSLPDEIDAEIESIDNLISDYEQGKSPMIRSKQELLEAIRTQNETRAKYVKIRNEIAPEDTKVQPGDELLESAEVVPIKQEGIISDLDLNVDRTKTKFNNVELYGDETFDELKYIEENGVHPRDLDPREGFARGGIVEVLI